mmetsp:Transcript_9170/g.15213  ORF Transcript_9170/g.15213 Transcript_9170/m.15213 type:complete len:217 (-) Transcript_9170:44-694(-)
MIMNVFVPAAFGVAAISFLANFLAPPILVALTPLQPPPSDVIHCEGYYPPTEDCLPLGTTRPLWFKKKRSNGGCPQWQIDKQWGERGTFVSKLKYMESAAKEYEQILADITADDVAKLGGEDALKPLIWVRRERGVAWSRMQDGIIAGNSEFHSDVNVSGGGGDGRHKCWTDALLPLYVEEFGVKPSEDFIEFVINFDVESFREQLATLKKTLALQ